MDQKSPTIHQIARCYKILFIYSKLVSQQIACPIHTKCYADLTAADCVDAQSFFCSISMQLHDYFITTTYNM